MKKHFLTVTAMILALGLIVTLTYVMARAQGEDGDPWPGTRPFNEEENSAAGKPGLIEDVRLAPDQGDADLRIAGSVLRPRNSGIGWSAGGQGGCVYASSGSTIEWWNSPVYLPQGSSVRRMRMYVYDTNVSHNCRGFFTVYDLNGDIVDEWGVNSSGSAGHSYFTSTVFEHTIDYSQYSYVVNWQPNELGSDMQICGFRLYYDPPASAMFLPLIKK